MKGVKTMVDSLSRAAGGGVTIEIKGEVFKVFPLTIGDLSSFESFLRSQKIKDFQAVAGDLEREDRVKILGQLASASISQDEISAAMSTMTGVQYLLWRSLKKGRPDLKYDDMDKYLDLSNFEELTSIVHGLGGNEEENPTKSEGSN